jgi:hypothetical protein
MKHGGGGVEKKEIAMTSPAAHVQSHEIKNNWGLDIKV